MAADESGAVAQAPASRPAARDQGRACTRRRWQPWASAGVVELVGILGYHGMVSMTLNAFEIGLPEGEQVELL